MDGEERTESCDVQPTKRYRHQALNTSTRQIRLIKLRPGQSKQPQCDISVFDLGSAPPFVALSYTWGPPSPQFDILVNGDSLSVRKNLFQFFQAYLMITDEDSQQKPPPGGYRDWETRWDEYLWIDQICIDQSSVRERNYQVGMMASIYAGCRGTIIWLADIRGCPDALLLLGDPNARDYRCKARAQGLLKAIGSVSGHEYFTRLWVVQEVILSNAIKVLCGHATAGPIWINWGTLWAEAKCYPGPVSSKSAEYLLDLHWQKDQMRLSYAIKTFNQSLCQDPRDKVYGLMGLVKKEHRLTIDYAKPLQELLLDLMAVFHRLLSQESAYPYTEYQSTLVELGRSWGIMSTSLDAFLYDVWVKPTYEWRQKFGDNPPGPDVYPHIEAMGYFPEAPNQNMKIKKRELLPCSVGAERNSGHFEPNEWIPTKDCWCYKVNGIIYEIYGLMSPTPLHNENGKPGYYGRRVRKTKQQRKSLIQLPVWLGTCCSFQSA